jgi:hypothetical protein
MLEKMKFPITGAPNCPACHSEKTIARAYIDELKMEGKLPKNAYPAGAAHQIALQEALNSPLMIKPEIPVLQISYEVCADCFTMYATQIQLIIVPVQIQQKQQRN